jgi:diguanylate cyclase (GGDEF)-like protein
VRSGAFVGSAEAFRQLGIGDSASVCPLTRVRRAIAESERAELDAVLLGRTGAAGDQGQFEREFHLAEDLSGRRVVQLNGEAETASDGDVVRVFGTIQDLTELVASREQIRELAYYDALTGLPNRLLFVDQIRGAISLARRRGHRLALMVLDLDNFKRINDTLGHGAGDEVLRVVGGRLRDAVREYDGISREFGGAVESSVARMGGDEFLLSVVDLRSGEEAAVVGRRLIDAMQLPVESPAGPIHVSASVGIAIYPEDGETFETLLKHADVALYQAKDAGRNAYEFYDRRMSEASLQRLVLESSLRSALKERELTVAIQPKVNGATGEMIGGEALVRWRHKEHGVVAPSIFVSLAERIGLATPLTHFVVEEVCRSFQEWREEGLTALPIAINLSPQLFRDPEAISEMAGIPRRYGIDPELIEFEVTETALIEDPKRADEVLAFLRGERYRIALDDFGTGYSSLSHLRRFALDSLKIDRTFVRDLQSSARDASITGSIIKLSSALGLVAVAEGVENEAQREILLSLGCTMMQGYLFGKPEPASEFTELLRGRQALR